MPRDDEVRRTLPGDEIIPDASATTRAITVRARPEEVWPWLVPIGYGGAGWYSSDSIDNDGRPSADRIVEECQRLDVRDRILMVPRVRVFEPNRWLLAGTPTAAPGAWRCSPRRAPSDW